MVGIAGGDEGDEAAPSLGPERGEAAGDAAVRRDLGSFLALGRAHGVTPLHRLTPSASATVHTRST